MNENAKIVDKFYTAFNKGDAATMNDCYAKDISFSDSVFPDLKGDEARAMWTMLTKSSKNFSLTYKIESITDTEARIYWEAHYDFSKTGRRVINRIQGYMKFQNGKIVEHRDVFALHTWAKQALGLPGLLLGWTPFMQNKIRATAADNLAKFRAAQK